MALYKLQFPVEAIRGLVGGDNGQVLYPVAGRQFGRQNVQPLNPQSTLQTSWRGFMTAISQAFGSLTVAQIAGWATLGSQIVRTDEFGQEYTLNAEQAYMAVNSARLANGQALVSVAPAYSLRALDATNGEMTYDSGEDAIQFSLSAVTSTPGFIWARFSQLLPGNARQARMTDVKTMSVDFAGAIQSIPQDPTVDFQFNVVNLTPKPSGITDRIGVYFQAYDANYVPGQYFLATSLNFSEVA